MGWMGESGRRGWQKHILHVPSGGGTFLGRRVYDPLPQHTYVPPRYL